MSRTARDPIRDPVLGTLHKRPACPSTRTLLQTGSNRRAPVTSDTSPVHSDQNDIAKTIVIFHSMARRGHDRGRLRRDTLCSTLASLPGHTLFLSQLRRTIRQTRQSPRIRFTIVLLSLSHFGLVGSALNRTINSRLLRTITPHLRARLQSISAITQLNKSRFTVLLRSVARTASTYAVTSQVLTRLRRPLALDNRSLVVATDVNVILDSAPCRRTTSLLGTTSVTVCQTGARKQDNCRLFSTTLRTRTAQFLRLRRSLHRTVTRDALRICCRPVVSLADNRIIDLRTLIH